MANSSNVINQRKKSIGDVAVDGLLAGMAAGVVMAAWLVLAGLLGGEGPVAVLGRFDPGAGGSPLIGALMHLAVAGFYGVGLALILRVLAGRRMAANRARWLLGAVYGLILWLAARLVVLPGLNQALGDIATLNFLGAHLLYGLLLGYLLGRHQNA